MWLTTGVVSDAWRQTASERAVLLRGIAETESR